MALLAPLDALQIKALPRVVVSVVAFAITVGAAGGAFVAMAGIEPFTNTGAAEVIQAGALGQVAKSPRKATTPYTVEHRFTASGSPWLDTTVNVVRFEVEAAAENANFQLEYRDAENNVLAQNLVRGKSGSIGARVQPDTAYTLVVNSNARYEVTVRPVSPLHIVYSR